jgi:hypothetical protein
MGMGHGGARSGAGRKPMTKSAVVFDMDGTRRQDAAQSDRPALDLSAPPKDLRKAERAFWLVWAPRAIEQRTLVPSTVPGFRDLCVKWAMKETIAKEIAKNGAAQPYATDQVKVYLKLEQRVDASLARFKLTAFGKPADGQTSARKTAANPWASTGSQAR